MSNTTGKKLLITLDNIKKDYQTGEIVTKVLKDIDFKLNVGEYVAIMGPSGSGKSTLMNIIGFLDKATSGKYIFKNEDVTKFDDDQLAQMRNEEIGFIFQTYNLLPRTTVLENVMLPLMYNNKKNKKKLAKTVIEQVGLGHRIDNLSNQLSGGEMQRVAIARALVNQPSLILADEPTGNLDSKTGQQILKILQDLNRAGNTILVVTHEQDTAEHTKRIVRIKDGVIYKDTIVANQKDAYNGELKK